MSRAMPKCSIIFRIGGRVRDIYKAYIGYLQNHADEMLSRDVIFELPYKLLREINAPEDLRERGAFFSGDAVFSQMIKNVSVSKQCIYDPAAGCGDLLLRYLEHLPAEASLGVGLKEWGRLVFAAEKEKKFVQLLKLRLWLLLYFKIKGGVRLGCIPIPRLEGLFPGVRCGDGLTAVGARGALILMNPPYQQVVARKSYSWCAGKVSLAAIFMYEVLTQNPQSRVLAVLPDVLRSGSRYSKWRSLLAGKVDSRVKIFGRFDGKTDVDVFTIDYDPKRVVRGRKRKISESRNCSCIKDVFDVHVGAVVLHRDKRKGKKCVFLKADNLPAGMTLDVVDQEIASMHAPVRGPFVVIRRTSSPSDRVRCISSVVMSSNEFHLDNHLIYLKPKCAKTAKEACARLHCYFQSEECTAVVNRLIRCRHLTVSIISNLPYERR